MAKPGLEAGATDAKAELRTLLLSDHGLELCSNGLAVTQDYLDKNADVVKRFVRAGLKGWKFALANPQKAADDEIKLVPSLKPDGIVAELGVVSYLAIAPQTNQHGLGLVDPATMRSN